MTFAGVSAPRRAAAAWLLLTFASLGATMVSGALAVGPSLAACSTPSPRPRTWPCSPQRRRRCRWDPGPRAADDDPTPAVPLAGVVLGYCLGFGALVLLLGGLVVGRAAHAAGSRNRRLS